MIDRGRKCLRIDIYQDGLNDPIHSVEMSEPTYEFDRRLEKIMMGLLRKMRDDCWAEEVYEDA